MAEELRSRRGPKSDGMRLDGGVACIKLGMGARATQHATKRAAESAREREREKDGEQVASV